MTAADPAEKANKAKEGPLSSLPSLTSHRINLDPDEAVALARMARRGRPRTRTEMHLLAQLEALLAEATR